MNTRPSLPRPIVITATALLFTSSCIPTGTEPNNHPSSEGTGEHGKADGLGPRVDSNSNVVFSVHASSATRVEVWLFDKATNDPARYHAPLNQLTMGNWSVTIDRATLGAAGLEDTFYYGFRVWGPNWIYQADWTPGSSLGFIADVNAQGHRFNPNKLLFDPYAKEISHDPNAPTTPNGAVYASGPTTRNIDTAPFATKGIVFQPDSTSVGTKPTRALKDDVLYEVHVRGLTQNDPSVPTTLRGTYAGAARKASELAKLGVTAIEFLPVQETQNDRNDVDPQSTNQDNYWGYITLNFFAPDRRYAADQSPGGPTREFKAMVKSFHDAGIKVLIDVVYNHTAEGGIHAGGDPNVMNLFSWRGLDNPTYYSLTNDRKFPYDNTGVGGNFNTYNPVTQQLIIDSLIYWRDELGVDGYRFDLASVLGNVCEHGCFWFDKFDPGTALNRIAAAVGPRPANGGAGVDLIAEPWAIGGNSYQVGNFPAGWSEWNGAYRDLVRKDQNQLGLAAVTPGQLAARFSGSADLYQDDGRRPFNSINFIVAHDGFTLADLYRCNSKNNSQPWPYGPSDGGDNNNHSWDQGGNGAAQRRATRNGFALLMLSAGTPMLTGGDEFMRSQRCNNNAYNLDSVGNWLDYNWSSEQTYFRAFAQRLIAFRNHHPALRPLGFYSGQDTNGNGMEQLRWFEPSGQVPNEGYFNDSNQHALAWRLDGTELGDTATAIFIAYNGWSDPVNFNLPWPGTGKSWYRVLDTCDWAEGPDQVRTPGSEDFIGGEGNHYDVCGRGVLLLIAR